MKASYHFEQTREEIPKKCLSVTENNSKNKVKKKNENPSSNKESKVDDTSSVNFPKINHKQ